MKRNQCTGWQAAAIGTALVGLISAVAAGPKNIIAPFSSLGAWSINYPGNLMVRMAQVRVWDGDTFAARVFRIDGNPAHAAIVERQPFDFVSGHRYTLTVLARADTVREISVVAQAPGRNGENIGLDQPLALGFPYRAFTMSFVARARDTHKADIDFLIGQMTGTVWVRDIRLVDDGPASASDAPA